jgi:hypothetical protein
MTVDKLMQQFGLDRADRGLCKARLRLGLAERVAGIDRDYTDLVRGLFIPSARQAQQRRSAVSGCGGQPISHLGSQGGVFTPYPPALGYQ